MAYGDSAADSLAAVRSAIGACLTAKQYSSAGRMKMMAELRDLRELEKELMDQSIFESAGGMCSYALATPITGDSP